MNNIVRNLQMKISRDELQEFCDDFLDLLTACREFFASKIEDVEELRTEILLYSSKISGIEKKSRQGVITVADYDIARNKVRVGLLELLDNLSEYKKFYDFLEDKEEEEAWNVVIEKNTILAYEEYFNRYPKGKYSAQTERIISELKSELKKKAIEEKERRKVLKNINFDKRLEREKNKLEDLDKELINPMDWWGSLPSNWKKVLAAEVGLIGIPKERNIQRILRLKIIDLSNQHQIKNLTPIRHLVSLKTLNLFNSGVHSLEGVETLVNLEDINIGRTRINSLKPLFSLQKLVSLVYSDVSDDELFVFQKHCSECAIFKKH